MSSEPTTSGKRRRVESGKSVELESVNKVNTFSSSASSVGPKDGKKKCSRNNQIMLWDHTKKGIFFEALNEFGRDFDKIHNYFNTKIIKIYGETEGYHTVKKEQIRDFYSNSIRKTGTIVDMKRLQEFLLREGIVDESNLREYREIITLITYWQVMKHSKRTKWPTEKLHTKVAELIFNGFTTLRYKSRNLFLKRLKPRYFAAVKEAGKVPNEFTVDILPYNNWSWGIVQNIAQNPRIRLKVSAKKSVSDIIKMLLDKWEKATTCSTMDTLNLSLRAPNSTKTTPETKTTPDICKKQSTPDGKHKNKEAPNQTSPLNNFTEEQIINDLANEVNVSSSSSITEPKPAEVIEMSDIVTELPDMVSNQNSSITEEELNDIIESIEPPLSTDAEEIEQGSKVRSETRKNSRSFYNDKCQESEELIAEKDRLASMEFWDINTPSLLTIGHVYLKFAPTENSEFRIQYEWKVTSTDNTVNSAYNTVALKRLLNLGHTEFQRISKQGKYKDLFITLNMDNWTSVLPLTKSVESQTDLVNSALPKLQMINASVQVGKERIILPQPSRIGGFIVPTPLTSSTLNNKSNSSFNLPNNRPKPKRRQTVQKVLLPKPPTYVTSSFASLQAQRVVSRDIGSAAAGPRKGAPFYTAGMVTTGPTAHVTSSQHHVTSSQHHVTSPHHYGYGEGVDLSSLVPDMVPDKQGYGGKQHLFCDRQLEQVYNGYSEEWAAVSSGTHHKADIPTLNSLVSEHSNHSLSDARQTSSRDYNDVITPQPGSVLDQLNKL